MNKHRLYSILYISHSINDDKGESSDNFSFIRVVLLSSGVECDNCCTI